MLGAAPAAASAAQDAVVASDLLAAVQADAVPQQLVEEPAHAAIVRRVDDIVGRGVERPVATSPPRRHP